MGILKDFQLRKKHKKYLLAKKFMIYCLKMKINPLQHKNQYLGKREKTNKHK